MFSAFEWKVAGRYFRARKAEGLVSVNAVFSFLGIMLGVATLIIVMAVMNGFHSELLERVLGLNGHANIYQKWESFEDFDPLKDRIKKIEGVTHVFPIIEGQALLTQDGQATGVVLKGIRPIDFKTKPVLSKAVIIGSLDAFNGNTIAIGHRLAAHFRVSTGDSLTLVSPQSRAGPFGSLPRLRSYEIAAIFDVGMFEYDRNFVFMPLKAAQAFMKMKNSISTLEIFVKNPDEEMDVFHDALERTLDSKYKARDWRESSASFFNALQVERNVMFLILTLIILVAAFNIISGMMMLVKDKRGDIAILRAMGATRGMVLRIFFLTGAGIGVFGTGAGVALGALFSLNIEGIRRWLESFLNVELFAAEIYFLSQLPAELNWDQVLLVTMMALGLTFAATLYPAWRAAGIDPAEALRYE